MKQAAECFCNIINKLAAEVFGIRRNCNVFLDKDSSRIAFNKSRILFFNLRYYIQVQHCKESRAAVCVFWFTTFCHEIAHNSKAFHNEEFVQEMENILAEYGPVFLKWWTEHPHD